MNEDKAIGLGFKIGPVVGFVLGFIGAAIPDVLDVLGCLLIVGVIAGIIVGVGYVITLLWGVGNKIYGEIYA